MYLYQCILCASCHCPWSNFLSGVISAPIVPICWRLIQQLLRVQIVPWNHPQRLVLCDSQEVFRGHLTLSSWSHNQLYIMNILRHILRQFIIISTLKQRKLEISKKKLTFNISNTRGTCIFMMTALQLTTGVKLDYDTNPHFIHLFLGCKFINSSSTRLASTLIPSQNGSPIYPLQCFSLWAHPPQCHIFARK